MINVLPGCSQCVFAGPLSLTVAYFCAGCMCAWQVLDMPLLIETHVHKMVGMVVVVSCSPTVQVSADPTRWSTAQHGEVCASGHHCVQHALPAPLVGDGLLSLCCIRVRAAAAPDAA